MLSQVARWGSRRFWGAPMHERHTWPGDDLYNVVQNGNWVMYWPELLQDASDVLLEVAALPSLRAVLWEDHGAALCVALLVTESACACTHYSQ